MWWRWTAGLPLWWSKRNLELGLPVFEVLISPCVTLLVFVGRICRYSFAIVGINITDLAYNLLVSGALKTHFYNIAPEAPTLSHFQQTFCKCPVIIQLSVWISTGPTRVKAEESLWWSYVRPWRKFNFVVCLFYPLNTYAYISGYHGFFFFLALTWYTCVNFRSDFCLSPSDLAQLNTKECNSKDNLSWLPGPMFWQKWDSQD